MQEQKCEDLVEQKCTTVDEEVCHNVPEEICQVFCGDRCHCEVIFSEKWLGNNYCDFIMYGMHIKIRECQIFSIFSISNNFRRSPFIIMSSFFSDLMSFSDWSASEM